MIIERLYLQNYKQFREPLELLPPEGAIGVVGPNGSGKTSLFESILWAFFGSRAGKARFANELIPWSGGSTKDPTIVEVTLTVMSGSFTVRRQLRSKQTTAEVRDTGGNLIVTGPADVSRWVEENLLHMDKVAFESTFFARQKELEFFAGVDGVKRQREIARILGIDQVEVAQSLLREDRNNIRAEVRMLQALLQNVDQEHLNRQLQEANTEHDRLKRETSELSATLAGCEAELQAARGEQERLEKLFRKHNDLNTALQASESAARSATDRGRSIQENLTKLEVEEQELELLLPRAARLPDIEREISHLDTARKGVEHRQTAESELDRVRRATTQAVVRASSLLDELRVAGDGPLPGWEALFELTDPAVRIQEAERVLRNATGALRTEEERLKQLNELRGYYQELRQREEEKQTLNGRLAIGRAMIAQINAELQELTGGEDLDELVTRLRRKREGLRREAASRKGEATAAEREASRLDRARKAVQAAGDTGACPTCRRNFEGDEHQEVVETLSQQAEGIRRLASDALAEAAKLEGEASLLVTELRKAEERHRASADLREKSINARAHFENLQDNLKRVLEEVNRLKTLTAGAESPPESKLRESASRVQRLRKSCDIYPVIQSLNERRQEYLRSAAEREEEISRLRDVTYDAVRHKELKEQRATLERLQGRIESIRKRLSARPELKEQLQATMEEERIAEERANTLQREITAQAFNEVSYRMSKERALEAERRREELRGQEQRLLEQLSEAAHSMQRFQDEVQRARDYQRQADERASEASRMDEMDFMLAEFYRELTARVRPALEAEASDLVCTLTDNKYNRLEFDANYGVQLYDGLSDAYSIERFSGGEADIVSLSARIALSKLISSRSSEALGFIVLDEVFGALDAGRRYNVLLTLDRLKRVFGQIFIISHVADVQESALLDELWIVEEDEEGKSAVRRLEPAGREVYGPDQRAL